MEIISVVKYGEVNRLGTIMFRHDKKKMSLSAGDIEFLYKASKEAREGYVFCKENINKYPDPSELPEKIPTAKRNRLLYNEYIAGASKEELAAKYGLKVITVKSIIGDLRRRDRYYASLKGGIRYERSNMSQM